jgi:hypothetical protein
MIGEIEERRRVDLLEFISAGGGMGGESQAVIESYLSHAFREPEGRTPSAHDTYRAVQTMTSR